MGSGMVFRSQFVPVLVVGLCMVMLLLHAPTLAQSIFGSIVGTVTDASAAVVPNAKVTATNVNTNEKRGFQTNEFGNYEINNLFPGVYSVEVEALGFGKQRKDGIKLSSQDITREDFALAVSAEVTQVTVFAEAGARIETDSGKLSNVRTLREIQGLPLIGGVAPRGIWRLLTITPGLSEDGSISGSRANQTDTTVDGVSQTGALLDFIESVEEFKVDFGNNSAEFKALGTITVNTKRGTNKLHGAIYDNYVTGAFRASNYFTGQRSGVPLHFFGTSAGGPVYLPKLYDGRNKTFWFLTYEAPFGPQSVTDFTPTVPLASWKTGDFSRETTIIKDPFNNGLPFTDNVIPPIRISNVAKQFLPFWPNPNFGNSTVFSSANYRQQKQGPFYKQHNGSVRVDHQLSQANTIFARYQHHRNHAPYWESNLPGTLGQQDILRKSRTAVISDTHIFTPAFINEFRFGLSFDSIPWRNNMVNGPSFMKAAGLVNVTRDGTIPDVRQVPIISFSQGAGIQGIQTSNDTPISQTRIFQWQDAVSKVTSRHSVRFGAEVTWRHRNVQQQASDLLGSYEFTSRYSGFNFADFLLGMPSTISRSPFANLQLNRQIGYDLFVNDNYRITSTLTLNLGLRYELDTGWTTNGSRISGFDKKTGSIVVPDAALALVSPVFPANLVPVIGNSKTDFNDRLFKTAAHNFAPRIGFAWRPFGMKTFVVRGGYGIFYETVPRSPTLHGTPFNVSEPSYSNPTDVTNPNFVQWPLAFPRIALTAGISLPSTYENGFRTPYAQNWNFTLETDAPRIMSVRASYVGTGARQMPYPFNINQPLPGPAFYVDKPRPFPTLPGITEFRNGASHTYHALSLEAQRKFSQGLMFQTTFTYAKDLGTEDITPENTYDLRRERGQARRLPLRRWIGFFVYQVPVGKGKRFGSSLHGLPNHLLSRWELSGSAGHTDGLHETPLWRTADVHGIAYTTSRSRPSVTYRPDCVSDPNFAPDRRSIDGWYDVNAFGLPGTPGVFGNCARGVIEGPAIQVLSVGLFKRVGIEGKFDLRVGMQATNVLNHPNFNALSSSALRLDNISGRAKITSMDWFTAPARLDPGGPRELRVDLRIEF